MMEKRNITENFTGITGLVLLLFAIASLVDRVLFDLPVSFGSFSVVVAVRIIDLISALLAVLTLTIFYRLLRNSFPNLGRSVIIHCFLPFVTVVSVDVALRNTTGGPTWWLLLFFAGLLIFGVISSEYAVCDVDSRFHPIALMILTGLGSGTFLLAMIAIRTNVTRLVLELPLCFLLTMLTALRYYDLWLEEASPLTHALICAVLLTQATAGLHYCPINEVSAGLLLFIWYYMITNAEHLLSQGADLGTAIRKRVPILALLTAGFIASLFILA